MTWSSRPLGEIATIERVGVDPQTLAKNVPYLGLEHIERGGRILGFQTVGEAHVASTKFAFDEGHVLYGKLRPNLGKVARPDFRGVCSTDILPIRPGKLLDRAYLHHFLAQPTMVGFAASRTSGANLPRISPAVLATFEIPLPPLDEQRRIAAILDQADALQAKRVEALAQFYVLTQSIFFDMFGEAHRTRDRLPLKSLTSVITKGTTPTSVGLEFASSGIPFLRVQNLVGGTVRLGPDALFIDEAAHQTLARSKVRPGDLLVSIAGTIGRCAVVPDDALEMNCNQAVAIVRPLQPSAAPWLLTWLSTQDAHRQIKASSVTGTISNLSLSQLGALRVPRVSDAEVADFNHVVSAVSAASKTALSANQAVDTLLVSLRARAFSGRL